MGSGERRNGTTRKRRGSGVHYRAALSAERKGNQEAQNRLAAGYQAREGRKRTMRAALENVDTNLAEQLKEMKFGSGQAGGRRARRAHTRKAIKKAMRGLPRNVKFIGLFTRKQAEKMLRRRH